MKDTRIIYATVAFGVVAYIALVQDDTTAMRRALQEQLHCVSVHSMTPVYSAIGEVSTRIGYRYKLGNLEDPVFFASAHPPETVWPGASVDAVVREVNPYVLPRHNVGTALRLCTPTECPPKPSNTK